MCINIFYISFTTISQYPHWCRFRLYHCRCRATLGVWPLSWSWFSYHKTMGRLRDCNRPGPSGKCTPAERRTWAVCRVHNCVRSPAPSCLETTGWRINNEDWTVFRHNAIVPPTYLCNLAHKCCKHPRLKKKNNNTNLRSIFKFFIGWNLFRIRDDRAVSSITSSVAQTLNLVRKNAKLTKI